MLAPRFGEMIFFASAPGFDAAVARLIPHPLRTWPSVSETVMLKETRWEVRAMNSIHKTLRIALLGMAMGMFVPSTGAAHHGWGWATGEEFEISGEIVAVKLGNPHGEVTINSKGENWIVEVGQPWRNDRAGLSAKLLSKGQVITAYGHRSAKKGARLMKAERVVINGKSYNLYPDRQS